MCAEFGLPADDQEALTSLLASMMDDCIIAPGEKVPPDPGPTELRGNSLYARVGGEFGPLVWRSEGGRRYLTKERVCHFAGGPEAVTCAEAEETMLLVPKVRHPPASRFLARRDHALPLWDHS